MGDSVSSIDEVEGKWSRLEVICQLKELIRNVATFIQFISIRFDSKGETFSTENVRLGDWRRHPSIFLIVQTAIAAHQRHHRHHHQQCSVCHNQ